MTKRLEEYLAAHPSEANTPVYRQKISGEYILKEMAFLRKDGGFQDGKYQSPTPNVTNESTDSKTDQSGEDEPRGLDSKGKQRERTVYEKIQEDEIIALASAYGEDFRRTETGPWAKGPVFEIKIGISGDLDISVTLDVGFTSKYPWDVPLLSLRWGENISSDVRLKLLQIIDTKPKELVGGEKPIIFHIVGACRDVLVTEAQIRAKETESSDKEDEDIYSKWVAVSRCYHPLVNTTIANGQKGTKGLRRRPWIPKKKAVASGFRKTTSKSSQICGCRKNPHGKQLARVSRPSAHLLPEFNGFDA